MTESLAGLLARLHTSRTGLSSTAADEQLREHGKNEMASTPWHRRALDLVRAIANPLVLILLAAGIASALLGEPVQAAIVGAIVLSSGLLDAWQTARSQRAVKRLQAQITPTATVCRDGVWVELPRAQIVPGDVIQLRAGDLVPGDARLLAATDLHVQQAALTGESLPAEKLAGDGPLAAHGPDVPQLVYLGTSVVSGSATAVVFATGRHTAFGDVVARLAARPEETEFERGTRRYGALILQTVTFLVLFVLIVNLAFGRDPMESVLFSVALAVGLTPEFLPMITTVTLAQGAIAMAREKVIVKHLSAIQNLGSIDVLCSDKTGTLTAGTMSLEAALDPFGDRSQRALALGQLNSRFETGIASPLDAAILAQPRCDDGDYTKTDELPFDFDRRRLSVALSHGGATLLVTKGAPENVLAVCTRYERDGAIHDLAAADRARCDAAVAEASNQGYRVLAVAYREVAQASGLTIADERELVLAGFLTFSDPLREGVCDSVARLRADGVQIKILSGDNELVSRHVCKEVGVDGDHVILGSEVEKMDDAALMRVAEQAHVFARVSPAQKHRIVRALKAGGHVVGFLGDGINDAPSLHGADVGISVAGAVDVAREASDIILLERRLDVLHAGILAGRRSFGNVLKYLLMGTSSNFGNMFSMAGASLLLPFLPMLPLQILLNNFLYDFAQITIPTDNVDPTHIRVPQRLDISVIKRFMWVAGPISSAYDFLTFFMLIHVFGFGAAAFHTGWFLESLATQTLVLFVIRTMRRPWRDRPSLPLAITTLAVVAIGIALPFTSFAETLGFVPLPLGYFAYLVIAVVSYLAIVEVVKSRLLARLVNPPQGLRRAAHALRARAAGRRGATSARAAGAR